VVEGRKDIDPVTGIATTGHEWDGLRELNTPLPRWWLWLFYLTIVWSIGYWIVYPAWPLLTTSTQGVFGYHTRSAVADDLEALKRQRGPMVEKLAAASLSSIVADPQLLDFARAQGRVAFADNCAPCHGAGGGGTKGYPNLNDDDWLWGGDLATIQTTITHGARDPSDGQTRQSQMPAFGRDGILTAEQIGEVADHVLSLSGKARDNAGGAQLFEQNCAVCHGPAGKGTRAVGAPDLSDAIWLYGGTRQDVIAQVTNPRMGTMPAWGRRLDPVTIKMLAAYVHSLGGGEDFVEAAPAAQADAAP